MCIDYCLLKLLFASAIVIVIVTGIVVVSVQCSVFSVHCL